MKSAPSKTRLLVNADNDHYFRRRGPEAMTEEAMVAYIDEVASGGKVTDFIMCTMGQRASYDSNVCEPIWLGEGETGADSWVSNAKLCHERNLDLFGIWTRRCREKGIRPWISMRMNDIHGVTTTNCFRTCGFWRNHPEFRRRPDLDPATGGHGWMPFAFDYAHEEVRSYHLAILKELLERYDADGYELDWMRWPCVFRPGHEKEDAHFLSEFMRECRMATECASRRRKHPILLSVRMPPKLVSAEAFGLAPVDWAKEGLVDLIVPCNFIQAYDFEMDLAGWKRTISDANNQVDVIPGGANMCSSSDYDGTIDLDLLTWRGWCDRMFAQGATGIYLFNADYLDGDVKGEIYRLGIDPVFAARSSRRLLASFDDCTSVEGTLGQRCPFPSRQGKVIEISAGTTSGLGAVSVAIATSERCDPPQITLNGTKPLREPTRLGELKPFCEKYAKDGWRWDFPIGAFAESNAIAIAANNSASPECQTVWCEIQLEPQGA